MNEKIILEKLKGVQEKYNEIEKQLSDPQIISDQKKFVQLNREYHNLQPLINAYNKYLSILDQLQSAKEVLREESDEEMKQMAKEEIDELEQQKEKMEEEIRFLLLPKDPEDSKNAVVEIRAGTGGEEAALFAADLFRMYSKYCEKKGWKVEITRFTESDMGGYKEIIFDVKGDGAYGILKFESGVHRVQRVPVTESQGRIHTSAASVAVFPEAEEFDLELKPEDIKKEITTSRGPGGQSVNTTYSAVRLTHIPTGIVIYCQNERSQLKNLECAMKELRTRVYNLEYQKRMQKIAAQRKTMVSTGDRSAKIRTYNFPQNRVTDHRINLTLYSLNEVLNGDLDPIIEQLQIAENAEKLKALEKETTQS